MTLTELMVVVVILGLLAATAQPLFRRDRVARDGREFAAVLARTFQHARFQAVAERTPIRAFIFADRVELRVAVPAADPNDPPVAADISAPITRLVAARPGVNVWDVKTAAGLPTQTLSTASYKTIEWNSVGQARLIGTTSNFIAIYIRNDGDGVQVANRDFRIDVSPLTGSTSLSEAW